RSRRLPKPVLLAIVAGEVVSAVLAYRDIAGRDEGELRGSKTLWRVLIGMNPGNSLGYWAVGGRARRALP
ncbi:MAG: hypothetical protein J0H43_11845, partial [Actinobacteria bacterium]|nr:hypothetical protein [Actinomycetota bacterium]